MKKLIFLITTFLFIAVSCEKEKEIILQPLAFNLTATSTPVPTGGVLECTLPDGTLFPFPKVAAIAGTATFLGTLDATNSTQQILNCNFNPGIMALVGDIEITLVGADGDELYFAGKANSYLSGIGTSFIEVTGGTGMFREAYGWMETTGTVDPATGIGTVTGKGMISPPR